MISHLRLHTIKKISDSTSIQANQDGVEFIIINHPKFNAAFTLHGAHLIHFQVKNHPPLIYTSSEAIYSPDKAIRGGIPICWPWFGNTEKSKQKKLPSHGFARISQWKLKTTNETEEGVEVEFSLASTAQTKSIWDHDFELILNAKLTDSINLTLITKNTGHKTFSYGGALHSYLHIADINQFSVTGLASTYTDSLDKGITKKTTNPIYTSGPIDAIFGVNKGSVILADTVNERTISIANTGNDAVVVWNPWKEGAKAFADMPDDGYQTMFCVESAITSAQGVSVAPNQTHALQTVIK